MDLRESAGALGVHCQTAYAWVRQGVLPARKVGRGYAVSEGDVAALAGRRCLGQEPARPIYVRDWAAQALGLYAAIAQGEETAARHRLGRLAGGVSLTDLCERVIASALRRVGDDWPAGRVSIAQEHRARPRDRSARARGAGTAGSGRAAGAAARGARRGHQGIRRR
jgi:excisionase family DNA binding protein